MHRRYFIGGDHTVFVRVIASEQIGSVFVAVGGGSGKEFILRDNAVFIGVHLDQVHACAFSVRSTAWAIRTLWFFFLSVQSLKTDDAGGCDQRDFGIPFVIHNILTVVLFMLFAEFVVRNPIRNRRFTFC